MEYMKMKNLFILVVILFLLAGCANLNSIYRANLFTNKGHFIDAKQRVIYSSDQGGIKKVCAEPSPDVLSALAASFERSSNKDSAEISESVDQISRIATTELIRERLYRACEAYFNGAISRSTYEYLQADFALTSSALLAIDRLGAGLDCKTKKLASVKADIDPKSGEKDEEDEEDEENKNQGTEYRCSHLDAQSVGHITKAIENIVETVNIYRDENKTHLITEKDEQHKREKVYLEQQIEMQEKEQENLEQQIEMQEKEQENLEQQIEMQEKEQENLEQQIEMQEKEQNLLKQQFQMQLDINKNNMKN